MKKLIKTITIILCITFTTMGMAYIIKPITMGLYVDIKDGSIIRKTKIGKQVSIGYNNTIGVTPLNKINRINNKIPEFDNDTMEVLIQDYVTIGNNCVIETGSKIYYKSVIGNNCIIKRGATVSPFKVIKDNTIVE